MFAALCVVSIGAAVLSNTPASAAGWTYIGTDYGIVDAKVYACATKVSGNFSSNMKFTVKTRAYILSNKISTYGGTPRNVAKQAMSSYMQYVSVRNVKSTDKPKTYIYGASNGATVPYGKTLVLGLEYNTHPKEYSRSRMFTVPVQNLASC